MQKSNIIRIKLKTPLWTGNAKGVCKTIKETSIIGSIRWWFRVMLRSKGIYCSKATKFDCKIYENEIKKNGEKSNFYLDNTEEGFFRRVKTQLMSLECGCPDCLIFGTTGWKKQITIRVSGPMRNETSKLNFYNEEIKELWKLSDNVFYYNTPLELEVISSKHVDKYQYFDILVYILSEISKYGGLGAKTQLGFGVFDLVEILKDGQKVDLEVTIKRGKELITQMIKIVNELGVNRDFVRNNCSILRYPALHNMFFYKYQLNKEQLGQFLLNTSQEENPEIESLEELFSSYQLTALVIRKKLREKWDSKTANLLLGKPGSGAWLNFSGIYVIGEGCWEMRFWGWLLQEENKKCITEEVSAFFGISDQKEISIDFLLEKNSHRNNFVEVKA